jgi:hypothetical protein
LLIFFTPFIFIFEDCGSRLVRFIYYLYLSNLS